MTSVTAARLASILGTWRSASPAYAALADRIRLVIADGRVAHGARLPAERDLAAALQVSRTTVAAAYARLRELGTIESRQGSGSSVSPGSRPAAGDSALAVAFDLTKSAMPAASAVGECFRIAAGNIGPELSGSGYEIVGHPALRLAIAEHHKLEIAYVHETGEGGGTTSDWVVLTRHKPLILKPEIVEATEPIVPRPDWRLWTDSYNNLIQVFRW